MKRVLDPAEISLHAASWFDSNGRLFEYDGELYRALGSSLVTIFNDLTARGLLQRWAEQGLLVDTKPTSFAVPGFDLVVRHRRIPFVSNCFEWGWSMLRDAALLTIDFNLELAAAGLETQDAHPWNVLFDGPKPVFVDLGSIRPISANAYGDWAALDEFYRYFLNPLYLFAAGESRIARWLLHDHYNGVLMRDVARLCPGVMSHRPIPQRWIGWLRTSIWPNIPAVAKPILRDQARAMMQFRVRNATQGRSRRQGLESLRQQVADVKFPVRSTAWSGYYTAEEFPPLVPSEQWTPKNHVVWKVLNDLRPASVLDIGSNRGWFSELATQVGSKVVAFDTDEPSIDWLYRDARDRSLNVLPLVMDITQPSPGVGMLNREITPAIDRLRCDCVLALALVHHLVFKAHLSFDLITEALSAFVGRTLLVEFVPADDQHVSTWPVSRYPWYTLDNFLLSLRQRFSKITVMESFPSPRQLVLCRRD